MDERIDRFTRKAGVVVVIITTTFMLAHLFSVLIGGF